MSEELGAVDADKHVVLVLRAAVSFDGGAALDREAHAGLDELVAVLADPGCLPAEAEAEAVDAKPLIVWAGTPCRRTCADAASVALQRRPTSDQLAVTASMPA